MANISRSLSSSLGIADIAVRPGANRTPLSAVKGKITRLPSEDHLLTIPESKIFEYAASKLTKVKSDSGDKTLGYNGDQLVSVTDSAANTVSTFNYDGDGVLVSIVVTSL